MRKVAPLLLLSILILFGVAGCAQSDPAAAIESYLQAKVESNLTALLNLSCAAWEDQARIEATSFESMNAELQGMECRSSGEADGYTLVECNGKIVTVYANGETREWELGAHPYRLVQEDGEWRMCGYHDAEGGA